MRTRSAAAISAVSAIFALAGCRDAPAREAHAIDRSADPAALAAWSERLATLTGERLDGGAGGVAIASLLPDDRPALVSFWATYCPPCIEEMASLELLAKGGRAVVDVSMDSSDAEGARAALAKMRVTYPNVVLDETSMKAAGLALERGLPFTIVTAAGARAAELLFGAVDGATGEAALLRASRLHSR